MTRRGLTRIAAIAAVTIAFGGAEAASAGVRCPVPGEGEDWRQVTPGEAGMDADGVNAGVALGTQNGSFAIRVYRGGCRVGEDVRAATNRDTLYESWSLAKSVTALVFGRAMTLGLIGPDDPLGSLVPEADQAHGGITMRQLLTMTSGLSWNGLRDYNIFMGNRLQEALTVPVAKQPGTYWEYSQSGPALIAEAVSRAVGEEFQAFAQRELFGPLGIRPGSWYWRRDGSGHTQGFFGLNMRADDLARLGQLMLGEGVYGGERLLSRRFVSESLTPVAENGCYGWLIWLNASKPCIGPRILNRPISDTRDFPSLPANTFRFSGLFGQWVTVFPSQDVIVVRTGIDSATFDGDTAWQENMYATILNSIRDDELEFPPPAPDATNVSDADVDRGFLTSLARPDEILAGELPPPLPPAGPPRARASLIETDASRVGPGGRVRLRLRCPEAWRMALEPRCAGRARIGRLTRARRYAIAAGTAKAMRLRVRPAALRKLERKRRLRAVARTRNDDALTGTEAERTIVLRRR